MRAARSSGAWLATLLLPAAAIAGTAIRSPVLYDSGYQLIEAAGSWRTTLPIAAPQAVLVRIDAEDIDVVARLSAAGATTARAADAPGKRWGREYFCIVGGTAGSAWTLQLSSNESAELRGRVRAEAVSLGSLGALAAPLCEALESASRIAEPDTAAAKRMALALRQLATQVSGPAAARFAADAWLAAFRLDYYVTSDWARAADSAQRAIALLRAAGAERPFADALFALGDAEIELSQERPEGAAAAELRRRRVNAARASLIDARRLFLSQQRPRAAARAMNDLGISQLYEAEYSDAERSLSLARSAALAAHDHSVAQLANTNLATTLSRHGEPQRALQAFAELLASADESTPLDLRMSWLHNSANPCFDVGAFDEALQRYLLALDLSRSVRDSSAEARALQGIGRTYLELGEQDRAVSFLERSLSIRQRIGDSGGARATLVNLGDARREQGALQEARELHARALAVPASPAEEARTRLALATDWIASGDGAAALLQLDALAALAIDEHHPYRVAARLQRATALRLLGRYDDALRAAQGAATDFGERRLVPAQLAARIEQVRVLRAAGRYAVAMQVAGETAALFERSWLAADSPAIRQKYRASRDGIYQEWVAAALQRAQQVELAGNPPAALELRRFALAAAASGRAREFQFAKLSRDTARAGVAAAGGNGALYEQLAGRFAALERAAERSSRATPSTRALEADIAELQARADTAQRSGASRPARAQLPDAAAIAALQRRMRPGLLLAYYQTGESGSWLWLLTRDRLKVQALDSRRALQSRMSAASDQLQRRTDLGLAAQRLQALASAAGVDASDLSTIDRVQVVGDAGLAAWPWTYLWNLHRPVALPALAVELAPRLELASPDDPPSPLRALLFGDPIYSRNDERVVLPAPAPKADSRAGDLARLPGTARELQVVAAALNGLPVRVFSGADATRSRFLAQAAGVTGVVHLAAHGFDNPHEPLLSRLVFSSYDARGTALASDISARELMSLRWRPWLVVLSACESASGEALAGEGVMSTARSVLASGARHVVGALWAVSDARSASLMAAFYQALRANKFDVAAALAAAQRSLLASEGERALPDVIAFAAFGAG